MTSPSVIASSPAGFAGRRSNLRPGGDIFVAQTAPRNDTSSEKDNRQATENDGAYAVKLKSDWWSIWRNKQPILPHLDIELTERCNNNCIHCFINLPADHPAARRRESSTDQVKRILSEAASLGALSIRFTGGEPLLRDDFADLYLFARKLGLRVTLFTNARLVTQELADLFARVPPLDKIEITVYGMRRESYEAVSKVRGSFEEFRRGMALLQERQVPFSVKGALLPPNRDEIGDLDAWAATLPGMGQAPSCSMFFDLRGRRDSPAKNRLIASLRVTPDQGIATMRRRQSYLKEMRAFCSRFMGPTGDKLFTCGAGRKVCVDAYGMLQPCLLLRDPDTAYNLRTGSLADALDGFFPRLRERRANSPAYLARCARCFLKGLCEQCPAKSWAEHGTLDAPVEYLCLVAHAQAAELGLIEKNERAWEVSDWKQRIERLTGGGVQTRR